MGNANTTCTAEALDNYLLPSEAELEWPIAVQIIVHLLFLWWLLLGVGLASDEFMNSIEFITATKKTITDKKTGEKREVDVWNPTVANLSLMALGSSAPEILLSCVELFTSNMVVGPLGSFTIIGSASFNLFVISAVCTAGMPPGQTRLIKETGVFATTTCFSLIAYIWTVAIVSWWTPNLITIEEGLITFAMFPTMLIVAYRVDKAEMSVLARMSRSFSFASPSRVFGTKAHGHGTRASKRHLFWRGATGQGEPHEHAPAAATAVKEMQPTPAKSGKTAEEDVEVDSYSSAESGAAPSKSAKVAPGPGLSRAELRDGGALAGIPRWDHVRHVVRMMLIARYWAGSTSKVAPITAEQWWADFQQREHGPEPAGGGGSSSHGVLSKAGAEPEVEENKYAGDGGDGGEEEEDEPYSLVGRIKDALVGGDEPPSSPLDWFLHIFSCPLKVACAFLPPADLLGGYPLFVSSIAAIGLIVFFVEESAQALSCAIGIAPAIAAITLVALGTSLPDTLASRSAALADKTADASVGNVNGSNAANIFMGLGVPWSAGAIYWKTKGLDGMPVPPELGRTLGFGVTVFEILAAICIAVFVFKRKVTGVELGGDGKWLQAAIYMSLWVTFLIFVSLYAQNITTFWD